MKTILISESDDPQLEQLRRVFARADQQISIVTTEIAQRSNFVDVALAIIVITRPDFKTRLPALMDNLSRRPWVSPVIAASEAISASSDLKPFTTIPIVSLANPAAIAALPARFKDAVTNFVVAKISASPLRRTDVKVHEATAPGPATRGNNDSSGSQHRAERRHSAHDPYDVWLARNTGYWLGAATALIVTGAVAWLYREELWSLLAKVVPFAKSTMTPAAAIGRNPTHSNGMPTAGPLVVDAVDCSVFGDSQIPPGGSLLLRVSFHLRERLEGLQRKFGQTARATPSQLMAIKLCRGDEVTVQFDGEEHIVADEPVQYVTWKGDPETLQFKLSCAKEVSAKEFHPLIKVWVNNRYIGRMVLELACSHLSDTTESAGVCRSVQALEPIFVSYSRRDWLRAKHLAEDFEAVRLRPFIDVLRIRSGEDWEDRLMREIDGCNSFCVIWSHAAKHSAWVKKEFKRAVDRQSVEKDKRPEIIVISKPSRRRLWERKSVPQPWEFAAKFHHSPLEISLVHMHRD